MTNNVLPLAVPVVFTVVMALILGARLRPENRLKFALRVFGGMLLGIAGYLALFVIPWGKGSGGITFSAQTIYSANGVFLIVLSVVLVKPLRNSVKQGVFIRISRARNPGAFWSCVTWQGLLICFFALFGVVFLLLAALSEWRKH